MGAIPIAAILIAATALILGPALITRDRAALNAAAVLSTDEESNGQFYNQANSFDSIRAAVDEGSGFVRTLWVTFVLLGAYLVIATASVTHAQLFLETPIKLPLLDVYLPLVAFFWVAPFIFIIFHFYLLLQLVVLAEKIRRLNGVIAAARLSEELRHNLRLLLPNDLLVQFLAGPRKRREGAMGFMFRSVAWITVVAGPVLLLLLVQYKFLPYQNEFVSWTNRVLIGLDLCLLWTLWRTVIVDTDEHGPNRSKHAWFAALAGIAGTVAVSAASLIAFTFPGEYLDGAAPQQWFHSTFKWQFPSSPHGNNEAAANHAWLEQTLSALLPRLSASDMDMQDWLRRVPEARRLIPGTLRLQRAQLVDLDSLKKIEDRTLVTANPWEGERSGRFNERHFIAANLSNADLRRVDLQNSLLDKANFVGANLAGALIRNASLNGALFDNSRMSGASLDGSSLLHASLGSAELRRASLYNSDLRQAWMFETNLNGAVLDQASLQGATLDRASLLGARLFQARLSGATLDGALLQGAKLESAALQGASLRGARLEGANLASAELQGADLAGAHLKGALLDDARLQGATIDGTDFVDASLVGIYVFRTLGTPNLKHARLTNENATAVFPVVWRRTASIDEAVVSLWTTLATSEVDDSVRRSAVAERMSRLLPDRVDPAVDDAGASFWKKSRIHTSDLEKYTQTLEEDLTSIACRREFAPHVARNLLQSAATEPFGRNWAAGPYFQLFAHVLRSSRTDKAACEGTAGFVEDDWERLDRLVESAPPPTAEIVATCVCSVVGAPFVARALTKNGMLASTGDRLPIIAANMRAGRVHSDACPGVRHFTDDDWKELANLSPEPAGN